jgi:TolB-like protein
MRPTRPQVQEALDRILASRGFRSSERMSAFLRFVVQHTLDQAPGPLKEFLVAERVFGRDDSFDPRTDTIVRVEARRLRSKLQQYYRDEGRGDPIVIELADRGYTPTFRAAVPEAGVLPARARRPWAIAAAVAALLAVAGLSAGRWRPWSPQHIRVGVLACDNLGGDSEDEPLSGGLAAGILSSLNYVESLTPVNGVQFRGGSIDARVIARDLDAEFVLLCTVQREGQRALITARLVNGQDGSSMALGTFDRQIDSEIDIQTRITRSIVEALSMHLTSSVEGRIRPDTASDEAHRSYLIGLHFWERGAGRLSAADLQKSVEYMEKAIGADPKYAAAHAGLADALGMLLSLGQEPHPDNVAARVRSEARLARDLGGDDSAEGHFAWAAVLASEGKWNDAEREYEWAIRLKPTFGPALQAYATLVLTPMRRYAEAIDKLRLAAKVQPAAAVPRTFLGQTQVYAGQFDEAIATLDEALELEGDYEAARATLALAHLGKASFSEALEQLKLLEHSRNLPYNQGVLGYVYAKLGQREAARKVLESLGSGPFVSIDVAAIHAGLGNTAEAMRALEEARRHLGPSIAWISGDPRFRGLDAEPGFERLLKQIGVERGR